MSLTTKSTYDLPLLMDGLPKISTFDEALGLARALHVQNERMEREIKRLAKENAELKGQTAAALQQNLAGIEGRIEGKNASSSCSSRAQNKSERRRRRRRTREGGKKRRSDESYGNTKQQLLPHEEVYTTLPESEQQCPSCGKSLQVMEGQTEDSETIVEVKRQFIVKQLKRQKYRPTCDCQDCTIKTASRPDELLSLGGRYHIGFAAQVATDKFSQHLPLNRQTRAMQNAGLVVKTQTLTHQLWLLTQATEPTYDAIKKDVLSAEAVHIDETSWKSLDDLDGVHMLWGMTSAMGAYYDIQTNRSNEGVYAMLGDYKGYVLSDGLEVYKVAQRKHGYKLAGCMAHARRKFFQAESNFPQVTPLLDKMDELFRIERELDDVNADLETIHARRQSDSKPIIDEIREMLYELIRNQGPAKTDLRAATTYLSNQWKYLTAFLDHPEVPLSNNAAERSLRPAVIGRKNYGGTRSRKGELISKTLYTLVETARIRGINPREYLEAIAHKYIKARRQFPRGTLSNDDKVALAQQVVLLPDEFILAKT